MANVLVTGGAGFIGSHLVPALLDAGHNVRVYDLLSAQGHGGPRTPPGWLAPHTGIEFCHASVTDAARLRIALSDMDAVIHLASETGTGESLHRIAHYSHENVQGTAVLMDLLARTSGLRVERVLLASSRAVYGEGTYARHDDPNSRRLAAPARTAARMKAGAWDPCCPDSGAPLRPLATREDDPTLPASIYGATKRMQEDLVRIACDSLGIGHTIFRLQNVYGEGQSLNRPESGILSHFAARIRRRQPIGIFEDGGQSRDFVHVADVVATFVAALDRPQPLNTTINLGTGRATSILEAARALSQALGVEPDLRVTGAYRLGDIRHNRADTGRLTRLLPCKPGLRLADGLSRFADWAAAQPLPEDPL